jgi:D-alanyl-D-alanine carboxypeptidase
MKSYTSPQTNIRKMLRHSFVGPSIIATIIATVLFHSASLLAPSLSEVLGGSNRNTAIQQGAEAADHGAPGHPAGNRRDTPPQDADAVSAVTMEDGVLPDGVSVFDDDYPGVANLAHALLQTLRQAATDAKTEGVAFYVTSGWRSPAYQNQLLREAVVEYGSQEEAERWVATADTSAHVSGNAVDLGGVDATAWLSNYGAGYGLCQIYENEPWHFELRPGAIEQGCPPMYADPTQDPRMRQ